jgi:methyltransferase
MGEKDGEGGKARAPMVTQLLFAAVVLTVVVTLARDWVRSREHTRRLLVLGAHLYGGHQTRLYLALSGVWAAAALAEVLFLSRPVLLVTAVLALPLIGIGRHLRRSAREALGQRWTLDVASLPGSPLVTGGIYGRMRHPEYTGTYLLLVAVPLLHGAVITAFFAAVAGAALLLRRVRLEEHVLDEDARYEALMGDRPRFHPRRVETDGPPPSRPTRLKPRHRPGDVPGHG